MYHGLSLGGGYVFEPAPQVAVDVYGHGTWVSMAGKTVTDNLAHHIDFKRAESLRLVSGFRASYLADKDVRPYIGLALDWETMGRPAVYVDGYRANRANMSGASALMELGISRKHSTNLFIDIRAAGSVGQRKGIGGLAQIRYRF
jgi:outer membrane autotransporter protein